MVYDIWTTTINGKEKTILPYGVLLEDWAELPFVFRYFKKEGFKNCWWDLHYKCVLINLDLKRYDIRHKVKLVPFLFQIYSINPCKNDLQSYKKDCGGIFMVFCRIVHYNLCYRGLL